MPPQPGVNQSGGGTITRVLADPVRMYLPSPYWNRARDFFSFNLDYNTLNASSTTTDQFTVQNDSDFLVLAITASAATSGAGTTEPAYLSYLISIQGTRAGPQGVGGDRIGLTLIPNPLTRPSTH